MALFISLPSVGSGAGLVSLLGLALQTLPGADATFCSSQCWYDGPCSDACMQHGCCAEGCEEHGGGPPGCTGPDHRQTYGWGTYEPPREALEPSPGIAIGEGAGSYAWQSAHGCTPLPIDGSEVPGAIESRGEEVCFSLDVTDADAGGFLDISVGLNGLSDSVLYVLDQDFDIAHPLDYNDDVYGGDTIDGSSVRWQPPASGVYGVVVQGFSESLRGGFTVSASRSANIVVSGAGTASVNGVYIDGRIGPHYLGPARTLRLPDTNTFLFRWHQSEWVIADLGENHDDFAASHFLYCAPAAPGVSIPPLSGWTTRSQFCRGAGDAPAPMVSGAHPQPPPAPPASDCASRDGCEAQTNCALDQLKAAIRGLDQQLAQEPLEVSALSDTVKASHSAFVRAQEVVIQRNDTLNEKASDEADAQAVLGRWRREKAALVARIQAAAMDGDDTLALRQQLNELELHVEHAERVCDAAAQAVATSEDALRNAQARVEPSAPLATALKGALAAEEAGLSRAKTEIKRAIAEVWRTLQSYSDAVGRCQGDPAGGTARRLQSPEPDLDASCDTEASCSAAKMVCLRGSVRDSIDELQQTLQAIVSGEDDQSSVEDYNLLSLRTAVRAATEEFRRGEEAAVSAQNTFDHAQAAAAAAQEAADRAQAAVDEARAAFGTISPLDTDAWDAAEQAKAEAQQRLNSADGDLTEANSERDETQITLERVQTELEQATRELQARKDAESQGVAFAITRFETYANAEELAMARYEAEVDHCDELEVEEVNAGWSMLHVAGACAVGSMMGAAAFAFKPRMAFSPAPSDDGLKASLNV